MPLRCFQRFIPKSHMARVVPLRFFRESSHQISNRKGCPPRFCSESSPKSQIARGVPLRLFSESSHQISNRKGCPPKIFFREPSPQISNRKACPPMIFSENQMFKSQIARCAPKMFSAIHSQISHRKGCPRKIFSSPQISNQRGVPLRFFRNSFLQISNGNQ